EAEHTAEHGLRGDVEHGHGADLAAGAADQPHGGQIPLPAGQGQPGGRAAQTDRTGHQQHGGDDRAEDEEAHDGSLAGGRGPVAGGQAADEGGGAPDHGGGDRGGGGEGDHGQEVGHGAPAAQQQRCGV